MSQDLERPSTSNLLDTERRVLIVEDDEQLAELLCHWLDQHGLATNVVATASSIAAANERLGALGALDLVLLDRRLPQGMGDELLSRITGEFDPIILMITAVQPTEALIRLPITDYLVKPIDEAVLVKRIALLEKLRASGVLSEYTDARKAALLEYHLDDPTASPLFRRFAARWDYDRIEVAIGTEGTYVYELYLSGNGSEVSVSIVGQLAEEADTLIDDGAVRPVGEVIPTGDGHAWIDANPGTPLAVPDAGYVVCEFANGAAEHLVQALDGRPPDPVARALESAYR